ncbi:MAG: hypothetical protein AB7D57_09900 [Desulfovibrionaceae bacterium]
MLRLVWWAGFTLLGIWLQRLAPGVDLLAPGLLLSFQEQRPPHTLALALAWVVLQDGSGTLSFGYGMLVYGLLALFFTGGRWLFDAHSFLFVCLSGLLCAGLHVLATGALSHLEGLQFLWPRLLTEAGIQAALFPLVWYAAHTLFPNRLKCDERAV